MSDSTQITTAEQIAKALVALKQKFPEMRVGQIVTWVATRAAGPDAEAVYDVEDAAFLAAANELLNRPRSAAPLTSNPADVRQAG